VHRRTLDLIFSVGGLLLAGLLLVLGLILQNQANFAQDYVHNQLAEQKITFTPVAGLSAQEKKADCLVENGGKPLVTGKQAECYANSYIALHLSEVNGGKTYAQTSNDSRAETAAAQAATQSGAADAAMLNADAKALDTKVQTLFRGDTLRGLLLTSYGFSIFGERAHQAALVCFAVALVLFLASVAGFVHAFTTPGEKVVSL
jgi:hypothetical protein